MAVIFRKEWFLGVAVPRESTGYGKVRMTRCVDEISSRDALLCPRSSLSSGQSEAQLIYQSQKVKARSRCRTSTPGRPRKPRLLSLGPLSGIYHETGKARRHHIRAESRTAWFR